jgi:uncharacterized protein YecE (DUF72 family)
MEPVRRAHIGCSGWNYLHWRGGVFYPPGLPPGDWLGFYRLPQRTAVEHWVEQTPPDFTFAVKVSRFLTHQKRLRETARHLTLLLERIEPLVSANRLGPLLWQLPPTFRRDDKRLAQALAEIPSRFRSAFEFRHESWFDDEILQLLQAHGAALVIADAPGLPLLGRQRPPVDLAYIRFHHGRRGRRGNYSRTELEEWAGTIRRWSSRGEVYAYFNNDREGFAPANASALQAKI